MTASIAQLLKEALAFVGAIDRLPLPVKSSPGFLVNRALTPYMLEAMVMLDEKIDKAVIDAAAKKFGMPMGPIELADQVGLDICLDVGDMLRSKFGDLLPPTPAWLREKVAKGELGRKSGKGFYMWRDGKADKPSGLAVADGAVGRDDRPSDPAAVERLRRLPARRHRRQCRRGRWRRDLRHRLRAVPRRSVELCAHARRGERGLDLACAGRKIRRQVYARCRLGEFQVSETHTSSACPANNETEPRGELCTRTLAMPADTNANGDIFGGWLLSQMDIGGGVFASKIAKSRTVTVAIDAMNFRKAVYVGDLVSVHANLVRVGRTSITVHLEAWVLRRKDMPTRRFWSPTATSPTSRSTIRATRRQSSGMAHRSRPEAYLLMGRGAHSHRGR